MATSQGRSIRRPDGLHNDAGALAESLLSEGITAMKIWPFDPFAVANGGNFIHATDLDKALVPFRQIRDAVGDKMEVMVELHSMWDLTSALAIARALRQFNPFWAEDPIKMVNPQSLAIYARGWHSGLRQRDAGDARAVPRCAQGGCRTM
jgi:galactonate dehydratase